jgi:hypothetical protein
MELRRLTTEEERRVFASRLEEARIKHGTGFCETPRSQLGRIHLAFAELYGLFEGPDEPLERMMAGFTLHDLGSIPQSYPKPDLTHLPADRVVEGGELWSFSKGAGLLARRGSAILAGMRQIQAILAYPICKPWDLTASYVETNFIKPCGPVEFPYGQTLEGKQISVQPMVIEGETLQSLIRKVFALGFETVDRHRVIRFPNPLALKPSLDRPSIPMAAPEPEGARVVEAPGRSEINGAAHA